jgi:23S rRNA pseudouridine1911/1915/1917 synthase
VPIKLQQYNATRSDKGTTLVTFIGDRLGISKRRAKELIDSRNVRVNGQIIWMAQHKLYGGDVVELPQVAAKTATAQPKPLKILFRDNHYIVIDKPAGMLAVGPRSCETALRKQLSLPELVPVHRLDRDTSGCLMFATSEDALEKMIEEFREHKVIKVYHAIVEGHLPRESFLIETPIKNLSARTRVRVLDTRRKASHVSVKIETGRTHQIRLHLAEFGNPVAGDRRYHPDAKHRSNAKPIEGLPRQMLHAQALRFSNPLTEKPINVLAPLPADFKQTLKDLRLT